MIKIIGIGYGNLKHINDHNIVSLRNAKNIYMLQNTKELFYNLNLSDINTNVVTLNCTDKNEYDDIAKNLADKSMNQDIVYASMGNPIMDDAFSLCLINECKKRKIEYSIYNAESLISKVIEDFNINILDGINLINGYNILERMLNKRENTIIIDIGICENKTALQKKLERCYGKDKKVYCYGVNSYKSLYLRDIHLLDDSSYKCVYIPKNLYTNNIGEKRDVYDLIDLVSILRGKDGCPWDKEQSHKSIENSMIEESYEVVDAIENDDKRALEEELGDVLFQIVFHVSLEEGTDSFDFDDVISGIFNKMVFRHPHVFGDAKVDNTSEVLENWDVLKNKEKSLKSKSDELDAIAKSVPALIRANKVQKKVSKVGFDFENLEEAAKKVQEELEEVFDEYNGSNVERIKEEVGDLLFSVVNIARLLKVDPEESLRRSTDKFIKRFKFIESESAKQSKDLHDLSLVEMNFLWEKAKNLEK